MTVGESERDDLYDEKVDEEVEETGNTLNR